MGGITFYLIVYFIYITLYTRKLIRISIRILRILPSNCTLTAILYGFNELLNFFKKNIKGLSNSNSRLICKKFGFQQTCTLNNLENSDFEQLKNYLSNNYLLDKPLIETVNKNVKKKIDLGIYSGKRHNLGYPVRGQRTLSNGKTQRR